VTGCGLEDRPSNPGGDRDFSLLHRSEAYPIVTEGSFSKGKGVVLETNDSHPSTPDIYLHSLTRLRDILRTRKKFASYNFCTGVYPKVSGLSR